MVVSIFYTHPVRSLKHPSYFFLLVLSSSRSLSLIPPVLLIRSLCLVISLLHFCLQTAIFFCHNFSLTEFSSFAIHCHLEHCALLSVPYKEGSYIKPVYTIVFIKSSALPVPMACSPRRPTGTLQCNMTTHLFVYSIYSFIGFQAVLLSSATFCLSLPRLVVSNGTARLQACGTADQSPVHCNYK